MHCCTRSRLETPPGLAGVRDIVASSSSSSAAPRDRPSLPTYPPWPSYIQRRAPCPPVPSVGLEKRSHGGRVPSGTVECCTHPFSTSSSVGTVGRSCSRHHASNRR